MNREEWDSLRLWELAELYRKEQLNDNKNAIKRYMINKFNLSEYDFTVEINRPHMKERGQSWF